MFVNPIRENHFVRLHAIVACTAYVHAYSQPMSPAIPHWILLAGSVMEKGF